MYNSDLTAQFADGVRQTFRITFTGQNETFTITNENIVQNGLKIDRYCTSGNRLELGSAISAELTLKLSNYDGTYNDTVFEDGEMYVEVGIGTNYIPFGKYIVDTIPRKKSVISLSALDYMTKFDKEIDWSLVTLPMTVADAVRFACTQCGVTLGTDLTTLPNSTYSISVIPTITTYRVLLQKCAYILGTCAYINRVGSLELSWYKASGFTLTAGMRMLDGSDMFEGDIEITGIQYDSYMAGEDGYCLKGSGNELLDHSITGVLMNIWAQIGPFTYRPFSCTVLAAPFLDPLDIITYAEKDGTTHTAVITNVTFVGNGGTALAGVGETAAIVNRNQYNGLTDEQKTDVQALIPFDFKTRYVYANSTFTFTAYVYSSSGADVTANYPTGSFTWQLRTESGLTTLGTGYTMAVAASALGYGGTVIATFSGDREYTVETTLYAEDAIETIATDAAEAKQDAIEAVALVSGKNTTYYADAEHEPTGGVAGDTWYVLGYVTDPNDQQVVSTVAVKRFDGVNWVPVTYSDGVFNRINAGNIITGILKAITIQGPNENTFWNLSTGEWQSHGEETAKDDNRGISWLQKTDVNIKDGVLEVKGEHENVWSSYSELIPTKKTSYMQAGIDETSIFDPTLVGGMEDVEPYGYAGIRLEGDTYRTFGLYQTTLSESAESVGTRTQEGVCYVRPYVTIGPEGMHFSCDFGDTFAAANHNYLKYALSSSTTVTPTEWTLRKAMMEYLEKNASEAEGKYVWCMDDTGATDPVYAFCDTVYDSTMTPAENLDASHIVYETACIYSYGISSSTTAQPTEWMDEDEIWQYLSDHTSETDGKYVWIKADYWWRADRYQYTYNQFLASEYQETYTIPDLYEALMVPAYNGMDVAAGNSNRELALLFNNRFKTVDGIDPDTQEPISYREYISPDYDSLPDSAVWPYKPGDVLEWNDSYVATGRFYNGRKDLRFLLPLNRPVSDYVTTCTFTGYIQIVTVAGGTSITANLTVPSSAISVIKCAPTPAGLDVWLRKSTAFTSGTDNNPCNILFTRWGVTFS